MSAPVEPSLCPRRHGYASSRHPLLNGLFKTESRETLSDPGTQDILDHDPGCRFGTELGATTLSYAQQQMF